MSQSIKSNKRNIQAVRVRIYLTHLIILELDKSAEFEISQVFSKTNSEQLKLIDNIDFNIFEFQDKVEKDSVLPLIGKHILSKPEYLDLIDAKKLESFLIRVNMGYLKNPYHNVKFIAKKRPFMHRMYCRLHMFI